MTSKRPTIGVSGNVSIDKNGRFPGYRSAFAYEDYITAVELGGGTACILPVTANEEVIKSHAEHIDGLLLTGGPDINPLIYGDEPVERLGKVSPERDKFDLDLVKRVSELGKPVLAICRGVQIVNVAFGGTLHQDVAGTTEFFVKHEQSSGPSIGTHTVEIEKDSYLHRLFGDEVITNSFHHQAIKELANGFKAVAHSKDGIIEAMQKEEDLSIVGVQWHPERMAKYDRKMLKLFEDFVVRCQSK